jgi:hypothetical protein
VGPAVRPTPPKTAAGGDGGSGNWTYDGYATGGEGGSAAGSGDGAGGADCPAEVIFDINRSWWAWMPAIAKLLAGSSG